MLYVRNTQTVNTKSLFEAVVTSGAEVDFRSAQTHCV